MLVLERHTQIGYWQKWLPFDFLFVGRWSDSQFLAERRKSTGCRGCTIRNWIRQLLVGLDDCPIGSNFRAKMVTFFHSRPIGPRLLSLNTVQLDCLQETVPPLDGLSCNFFPRVYFFHWRGLLTAKRASALLSSTGQRGGKPDRAKEASDWTRPCSVARQALVFARISVGFGYRRWLRRWRAANRWRADS